MERISKAEFWRGHDRAQRGSEYSVSEYCKKHGLNFHTFGYWRHKLKKMEQSLVPVRSFVQVISKPEARQDFVARLRLSGGMALECVSWPDPEWVRRLGRDQ